ncbi:hypothetical protein ACM16X_02730 [Haloarcula japonica]|uniref:hypothetical protein n=1 Tax=Haloarcula japonica TaxID=29282 RepID=UPI0039F6FF29
MGVASFVLKLLKVPVIKGPLFFLKGLRKLGLYSWLIFFLSVVPGVVGSYQFLISEGVEWYFAVPASVGIEFGGILFNVINAFYQLEGAGILAAAIIVGGILSSLANFLWGVVIWYKVNKAIEGQNLSALYIGLIGSLFLFLCVVFTLVIDQYVLADGVRRLSGMTYVLSSPGEALAPVIDVVQVWSSSPDPGNATSLINQSSQNGTVGG